jgi:hypothetical protein
MNEKFKAISDALGSDFEEDEEYAIEPYQANDISKLNEPKDEEDIPAFGSEKYLRYELESSLSDINEAMYHLKHELTKQGARSSSYDSYSRLSKERTAIIKELKDFEITVADRKDFNGTPQIETQNNTFVLTGADLLDSILNNKDGVGVEVKEGE